MDRKGVHMCSALLLGIFLTCNGLAAQDDDPITLDTDPNLAAWWKFDETAGKIAADASKHERVAAFTAELSFDKNSAAGRIGQAVRLDGGEGYLTVTKYKGIGGTRPRTLAAWIKTATASGEIVSWGAVDFGKMWTLGFIRGRVGVTPHGGYLYMNAETHDDRWHHVAVVVRQAETPNLYDDVTLYLDGQVAVIHDIGLLDLWPIDTGDELDVRIGRNFKGLIDDLRIYSRVLSEDEIHALFTLDTSRPLTRSR
ncbi:MAG TPA: LamG domain-containing protein [Sedimentisphaerales bacterium]|nr:LamG domain-containing protein [Sedimentisphaerales bacterium]HRS11715.1 LamG domain-containing protein [Sedimentisphaerales bacterium]HRV48378.1 LamG domain-containing protein [Sedimentisphaerales bacterium]